jgi:hypothetical protein
LLNVLLQIANKLGLLKKKKLLPAARCLIHWETIILELKYTDAFNLPKERVTVVPCNTSFWYMGRQGNEAAMLANGNG